MRSWPWLFIVGIVVFLAALASAAYFNQAKSQVSRPGPTPATSPASYQCPTTDYVDCMPQIDAPPRTTCQPDYLEWAQVNCPGFQGAAY